MYSASIVMLTAIDVQPNYKHQKIGDRTDAKKLRKCRSKAFNELKTQIRKCAKLYFTSRLTKVCTSGNCSCYKLLHLRHNGNRWISR